MRRPEQLFAPKKPDHSFFNFFSIVESSLFATFQPQKNKLWSSQRYLEAAALQTEPIPDRSPILRELSVDLQSFFDEHAALMPVVNYEYGLNGIQNGYSQSMSEIAKHHLEFQQLHELPLERAGLELAVAQSIEAWMSAEDIPIGSQLVAISPRGTKPEGYPGLDLRNYALVNVFEKTENGFLLHQYRSYDPNDHFSDLQAQLLYKLSGSLIYANPTTKTNRKDLKTINSLVSLGPQTALETIEEYIYQNKKHWKVNIDTDLPQLDITAYSELTAKAIAFCLAEFGQLLAERSDVVTQIGKYDLFIQTVKEAVTKWTETHAQNYQQTSEEYELDLLTIKASWQARWALANQEVIDHEQEKLLKKFEGLTALNPALPLQKMTSWAHCIVGTPSSLLKLQSPELMKALQLNNLSKGQIAEFIGEQRAQLWKPGKCQRCGSTGMVGECSICLNCELELGGQKLPENLLATAEDQLLDSLRGEEKTKAQALFSQLSELVLRKTVSFEQLLHGDFVNPTATVSEELEPRLNRLFFAPNPLHELEKIVLEISGKDKDTEQESLSSKKFNFGAPQPTALAA